MGFCHLLKIRIQILVKTKVKILAVISTKNFLIMLKNQQQMHLKLIKITAGATDVLIDNKIADAVAKSCDNKI